MLREMAGAEHQILNHFPQSPVSNLSLDRLFVFEGFPAYHPEEVAGDHRQLQDQSIGGKLSGRKTFHIRVSFQFTVILLAFSMCMTGRNDIIIRPSEVCPEHVQFNVREHKDLAMLINGTLNDFKLVVDIIIRYGCAFLTDLTAL